MLLQVFRAGRLQPVLVPVTQDLPVVVVQEHVVVSAQEYPVAGIRSATVAPLGDVVDFAASGRLRATWEDAPAVANRDRESLRGAEESLRATEVDDLLPAVELYADHPGVANETVDCCSGDRLCVSFEEAVTTCRLESSFGDDDSYGRAAKSEEGAGVGIDGEPHEVDECVGQTLVARAGIIDG